MQRIPEEERRGAWRELLKEVYRSTVDAVRNGFYILPNGRRVDIPDPAETGACTKFYSKEMTPPLSSARGGGDERSTSGMVPVEVIEDDCLAVARRLVKEGYRPAVLNMASAENPGGGVHRGSNAQEEYLFRCSDYFRSLYRYVDYGREYGVGRDPSCSYPLHPRFGGVFSRGVTVFRGVQKEGYPFLEEPWQVDFIAVAGVAYPETVRMPDGTLRLSKRDEAVTRDKIRTIFSIAVDNGVETLVLGAMGCGAFRNPPEHIAELFREVLQEPRFLNAFEKVVFAIRTSHSSRRGADGRSLPQVFRDAFAVKHVPGTFRDITRFIEPFSAGTQGRMEGGKPGADGVITFPHAVYDESVDEFLQVFYDIHERHPELEVRNYLDLKGEALKHGGSLEEWDSWCGTLDLRQLFQALAIFIRGDRFCDGFLLDGLESGMIFKVLEHIRRLDS
ncbi:MAG: TIGR02452 family protein [Mailhella sp.]|nr:TIGR02452 family protein [Mailhella sp.]